MFFLLEQDSSTLAHFQPSPEIGGTNGASVSKEELSVTQAEHTWCRAFHASKVNPSKVPLKVSMTGHNSLLHRSVIVH